MKENSNYALWKSCEHLGIKPPRIKDSWDDNNEINQALILAYSQIREAG